MWSCQLDETDQYQEEETFEKLLQHIKTHLPWEHVDSLLLFGQSKLTVNMVDGSVMVFRFRDLDKGEHSDKNVRENRLSLNDLQHPPL